MSHSYHAMESCSEENLFKNYYSPCYTFTKPEYLLNENNDNIDLQLIYESAKCTFGRSPKKEPGSNYKYESNQNKAVKKGAYNFKNQTTNQHNNNPRNLNSFITRDEMQKPVVDDHKVRTQEKLIWTLNE